MTQLKEKLNKKEHLIEYLKDEKNLMMEKESKRREAEKQLEKKHKIDKKKMA